MKSVRNCDSELWVKKGVQFEYTWKHTPTFHHESAVILPNSLIWASSFHLLTLISLTPSLQPFYRPFIFACNEQAGTLHNTAAYSQDLCYSAGTHGEHFYSSSRGGGEEGSRGGRGIRMMDMRRRRRWSNMTKNHEDVKKKEVEEERNCYARDVYLGHLCLHPHCPPPRSPCLPHCEHKPSPVLFIH